MKRSMFNRNRWLVVILGLILSLPTMAQKKAPPGSGGGGAPAEAADDTAGTTEKKAPPGQGKEYKPSDQLIEQFKDAADKDQNPKVLMMVGQDARAQGAAPVRTRGADAGGADPTRRGVGDVILDFDKTGITDVLENALGVYLQEGFGEFVDPSSLAEAERTEIKNKIDRDDPEGLSTIAQKLNADVVIFIRFQELPVAERGDNKERFRCVAEIKHLRRRVSRKVSPFDWDGPIDVRNARRYAGALSEEFMKQYIAMVKRSAGRGQDISVRLEKLPSAVSQKQVKTWLSMDGGTVKISDWTTDVDNLITCEATIVYKGDASDIEDAIRKQSKSDGIEFTLVKAESNRVILMGNASAGTLPLWYAITDPEDKTPEREQFKAMVKKQPQTLCVVVNWLLDPVQYKLDHMRYDFHGSYYYFSGSWSAPAVSLITGEPRGSNSAVGTQTVSLEKVGNELKDVFSNAGIEIKEFDAANFAADKEAKKLQSLDSSGESDLVKVMKQTANTDLILWAKVRIVRDKELANGNAASMSLTLYDTNTGRYIASVNWDGDKTVLKRPDLKGIPSKFFRDAHEGEVVGRYIAGNLMGKWMKKAPVTEFQVHNAKNFEETRAFAEAMGTIEGITVSNIRHDNAMGTFQVTYEGNLDTVKKQIATKSQEYPGARTGKVTEAAAGKIVWTFDKDQDK